LEPFRGSFVGRHDDLIAIERLLHDDDARLLTLLGPGGVGKTRLLHRLTAAAAAAVTKESAPRYASIVWCDLSSAHSAGDIITRVAAALSGVALGAGSTSTEVAIERVARVLARRGACLLALDNLEQLEATAICPILSQWLGLATKLTIVTTSRVRLGLAGEVVHRVEPLVLANATEMFRDRAEAVRGPFSEEERILAERIVVLLEGMPLALEMAATKLCVLSPAELLERLSRPLSILKGSRADPDRHASLSRVLDDSWELLTTDERHVLASLGVFMGGFTVSSAEAVIGCSEDVIAILQRLVDSSLLRSMPSLGSGQRRRHALYEVVREYALERLAESGRVDAVKRAHAHHFAAWGEERITHMGARDSTALEELVDEEANLAAAALFLRERSEVVPNNPIPNDAGPTLVEDRLRILSALEPIHMLGGGGRLDPWVSDLEDALSSSKPTQENRRVSARAALALARGLHELGRPTPARKAYERAIADGGIAKMHALESFALSQLGRLAAGVGDWDEANVLFERARTLAGAGEASAKLANACFQFYGAESGVATDIVGGISAYVDWCRRSGSDPRELVFWLVQLGRSESELFRSSDDAAKHLEEALTLARKLGDIRGEGFALFGIGSHDLGCMGRVDESLLSLDKSVRLLREAGTRRFEAWALGFVGIAHALKDRWDEARSAFDPSIEILADVRDAPREAHLLAFRAVVHARQKNEVRANEDLKRASVLAPESSLYHAWTIELCRAQIDVLHARHDPGPETAEDEHLEVARALLRRAGWPPNKKKEEPPREWPWGGEFYEPRLAAELLERALFVAENESRTSLVVATDGSYFIPPSSRERIECGGREKLQRILVLLAKKRIDQAGTVVPPAHLIEVAWGAERIQPSAASNRLHVALDTLKKLGLRGLVVRGEGGWMLDPNVPCAWAPSKD
jgi:predicted ATPase/tetratricopeptide (TPR) repeat protein